MYDLLICMSTAMEIQGPLLISLFYLGLIHFLLDHLTVRTDQWPGKVQSISWPG